MTYFVRGRIVATFHSKIKTAGQADRIHYYEEIMNLKMHIQQMAIASEEFLPVDTYEGNLDLGDALEWHARRA